MKKIFNFLLCTAIVLVPVLILVWAIYECSMPIWSICFGLGIIAVVVCHAMYMTNKWTAMMIGSIIVFLLTALSVVTAVITKQGLGVVEALGLPCEAATAWLFLYCGGYLISKMKESYNIGFTFFGVLASIFLFIVAFACLFDLVEFYAEFELSPFWGQVVGIATPVSAVLSIIALLFGMYLDQVN